MSSNLPDRPSPSSAEVDAARILLTRLGLRAEDLLDAPAPRPTVPTSEVRRVHHAVHPHGPARELRSRMGRNRYSFVREFVQRTRPPGTGRGPPRIGTPVVTGPSPPFPNSRTRPKSPEALPARCSRPCARKVVLCDRVGHLRAHDAGQSSRRGLTAGVRAEHDHGTEERPVRTASQISRSVRKTWRSSDVRCHGSGPRPDSRSRHVQHTAGVRLRMDGQAAADSPTSSSTTSVLPLATTTLAGRRSSARSWHRPS
jgi:hypothetical protein